MSGPDAEEQLAYRRPSAERKRRGAVYTPAVVVRRVFDVLEPLLPAKPVIIDPACGAGAFLVEARRRRPGASLVGVELDAETAALAQKRVRDARIETGDALGFSARQLAGRQGTLFEPFTLWAGNPPFNGTSPRLADVDSWHQALNLLPPGVTMPPGTSLREDYVFFLLLALRRLEQQQGALAFITNASWLDTFAYASIREALVKRLHLRHVERLPSGSFSGTKVETCFTVWTTEPGAGPTRPEAPSFSLQSISAEAQALNSKWLSEGVALDSLIPVSLPGLKTRFDELLTAPTAELLLERLAAFVSTPPGALKGFGSRFQIELSPKLEALHLAVAGLAVSAEQVRPLIRVRGHKPPDVSDVCYLDRRFILRGDHRLRGAYDPHHVPSKLIFNVRERPLVGHFVTRAGCVTAWRHTRFAPVYVPQRVRDEGLAAATRGGDLGPMVPNVSALGLAWAAKLGGPTALFEAVARFIQSPAVQQVWVPAFGASQVLPIPWAGLVPHSRR